MAKPKLYTTPFGGALYYPASRKLRGLPVLNGLDRQVLQVTKRDIRTSKRNDRECCVLAQCATRTMKGIDEIYVCKSYTYILHEKKWIKFRVTQRAHHALTAWDKGAEFPEGVYYFGRVDMAHQNKGIRITRKGVKQETKRRKRTKHSYRPTGPWDESKLHG